MSKRRFARIILIDGPRAARAGGDPCNLGWITASIPLSADGRFEVTGEVADLPNHCARDEYQLVPMVAGEKERRARWVCRIGVEPLPSNNPNCPGIPGLKPGEIATKPL